MSQFLLNLKEKNQFPIIFIGSGITRRYFKESLTWDDLLISLWNESNIENTYYSRYNQLKKQDIDVFNIYTTIASEIEEKFDEEFYNEKIYIDGLTPENAHKLNNSPFKKSISNRFIKLTSNDTYSKEISSFKSMLSKARMIVTTNYDTLIEDSLNNAVDVKIGNTGLFEYDNELCELYKIHGCVTKPDSIIITENDYDKRRRTSAIINAKILSNLTGSPIIFLGYSMTDYNVQSLLKDLQENMPFSIDTIAQNIAVVNYVKGENNIVESLVEDPHSGIYYTKLDTDNFKMIYESIAAIDQGFRPFEIQKYYSAFKEIINIKGAEGKLDKVLTSFVDLENLPNEVKNKNLVVAFGDKSTVYKFPNYVDYLKSYFLNDKMPEEIALEFIIRQAPNSTLPVSKYIQNINRKLSENEIDKLNKRLSKFSSLDKLRKTVSLSNITISELSYYDNYNNNDLVEIVINNNKDINYNQKFAYLIHNIEKFNLKQLIEYILNNKDDKFIKRTLTRKLFMAYSLKEEIIVTSI